MNKMREALRLIQMNANDADLVHKWATEALAEPEPAGEPVKAILSSDVNMLAKLFASGCLTPNTPDGWAAAIETYEADFYTHPTPEAEPEPAGGAAEDAQPIGVIDLDMGDACVDFYEDQLHRLKDGAEVYLHPAPEAVRKLAESVHRLLSSGGAIADATDELLREAVNDTEADPIVREQAAAVLECRAALAEVRAMGGES